MNRWYRKGALYLAQSMFSVAPGSFNFRVIFLNSGYIFDATDEFVQDLNPFVNECVDVVLGSMRQVVAGIVISIDTPNERIELDCNDFVLVNANCGTIASMVLYKELAFDSTRLLIGFYDEGFPKVTTGVTETVVINDEGLLQFVPSIP